MKSYGQFCPLAQATQLLCKPWTLIIVRELTAGSTHFGELQKGAPLMSPTLLSTRLKELTKAGVIEVVENGRNHKYKITEAGKELIPIIQLMGIWGHRWVRSNLDESDLDAGLLMWDMRRSVNPKAFPDRRVVVQFEYADAPIGSRDWWLVSELGEIDLCLNDPGFEVDVMICSSLKAMTKVWICGESLKEAQRKNEIKVMGDSKLTVKLQSWLCASGLAQLGSLGAPPKLDWGHS